MYWEEKLIQAPVGLLAGPSFQLNLFLYLIINVLNNDIK